MYYPQCAEPNGQEVKFCRACGEDLTIIAQAVARHLPVMLVSKLDKYVERKDERMRRDGMLTQLLRRIPSDKWYLAIGLESRGLAFCCLYVCGSTDHADSQHLGYVGI